MNKKLIGNRVFIEMPKKEESKLIVDSNTKEALEKELLSKMNKLKVHSVGESVHNIKPGDIVLIDPSALSKATLVPLSESETVMLVSPFDIIMVWD